MFRPANREENRNRAVPGRPTFGTVRSEGTIERTCPTCGHAWPNEDATDQLLAPQEPVVDVVPDPVAIRSAFRVLAMMMEVLDGRRPVRQMTSLAAPWVIRYLRAIPLGPGSVPGGARVLSFHPSQPHEGSVEVAASVRLRGRRRAVAASFELTGLEDWVCDTLRIL